MSKIKCFNCGEYGHFAGDCQKACNNANIAQESEQKGKSESMLDLDSTSVSEECVMVCMELQYEDASKDEVVYGDQGISIEEYEKATDRIPSTTPGAEPPRDARDSGSARSHSMHLETSSSDRP